MRRIEQGADDELDKLMVAQSRVPRVIPGLREAHTAFRAKPDVLVSELEED